MEKLKNANVVVVGDLMLDRYWEGDTSRISPEAPVPVIHVQKEYHKAGGAGNVVLNIATLQGKATVVAIVGQDDNAKELKSILSNAKVNCQFILSKTHPTVTKLRVLSQHQQLIRADFEKNFEDTHKAALEKLFVKQLPKASAVILSDYGKGTLSHPQALINAAKKYKIPVLVDPKGNDFTRYKGATLITPNLKEFELVAGPCKDDKTLIQKAREVIKQCKLSALLITLGARGMMLVPNKGDAIHIPTQARDVFDVTGAGDTVIAVMAMALGTGHDYETSMKYANAAAGVVVGKLGTATVTPEELHDAMHNTSHIRTGMMTKAEALNAVAKAKAQDEKIVFTNGCFDILHAGHVDYLQAARAYGDRLIVAVNTDSSVKKLKGESRPVNSLEDRMRILEALDCVDWVVPFAEDTPAQLIKEIMPDVLVKGADYQVHEIAGSDTVLANGGEVKTIKLTPGRSTTATIKKMQRGATKS